MLAIDKRMVDLEAVVGADRISVAFVSEGDYWKGLRGPCAVIEVMDPSGHAQLRFVGTPDEALQAAWNHYVLI